MARAGFNKNNSAVKRIMQEARELANDPCTDYSAAPLEDDIFEWHCTLRGPPGTEFEGGLYHFRILLPTEYPFRPPSIMMLTPNGRFELNTKICISFTSYHEELWQPAWGVRTAIIGLQGFFPLKGTAAVGVGALEYPASERRRLAALSRDWVCPTCKQPNHQSLPDPATTGSSCSSDIHPSETPATVSDVTLTTEDVPLTPTSPDSSASVAVSPVPILAPTPTRPIIPVNVIVSPKPSTSQQVKGSLQTEVQRLGQGQTPQDPALAVAMSYPRRPPVLLDLAICVLLVLVFALIIRRIF
ncbi:UBC-like protein [Sparassis latifolia]|uniref:UBC-like protein n=1 Tax=Sparassis crispa TaxID=139825 RepID=A0A401GJZ4_9APHY|nr:UBC-like protein [Sparassis crispa]GBE82480.1 UBC-like protein [Sparassis crispa]